MSCGPSGNAQLRLELIRPRLVALAELRLDDRICTAIVHTVEIGHTQRGEFQKQNSVYAHSSFANSFPVLAGQLKKRTVCDIRK